MNRVEAGRIMCWPDVFVQLPQRVKSQSVLHALCKKAH